MNPRPEIPARRARAWLRREDGAIDLPSTMTSVLVITAFLAVAAVVVFGVIPWAQDRATQQQVDQLVDGQSAYYAMASSGDLGHSGTGPRYGHLHSLESAGLLSGIVPAGAAPSTSTGVSTSEDGKVKVSVTNATATAPGVDAFQVWIRSDTGRVFTATHDSPMPSGENLMIGTRRQPMSQSTYTAYASVWQDLAGREGEAITVSFDIKVGKPREIWAYAYQGTGLSIGTRSNDPARIQGTTQWQRHSFTTTVERYDDTTEASAVHQVSNPGWIIWYDQTRDTSQRIQIRDIKIETGSTPTAYAHQH
ncbi:hypothetical protein LG293_17890 (plasmid) [Citricoccus nitrophenolicus]